MDDNEFLRGLEGEKQQGQDLVNGAEHLVRLKIQSGQSTEQPYPDLEIEKKAGLFSRKPDPMADHLNRHNAWADEMNQPANIDKINELLEHHAMQLHKKPLNQLNSHEWELAHAHAMNDPYFTGLSDKHFGPPTQFGKDKKACMNCGQEKNACMCKTAGIKEHAIAGMARASQGMTEFGKGVKGGLKWTGFGSKGSLGMLKDKATRTEGLGQLTGLAAPAMVAGVAGHAIGKHQAKEKLANALANALKNVDPTLLATAGLGAAAMGAGTYLSSRPQADTGKSKSEEKLEGRVEANQSKPEGGLLHKMKNRTTELTHGYSKAFREHPVKAGLLGATIGGVGGYRLGRLAGGAPPKILAALKSALSGGKK